MCRVLKILIFFIMMFTSSLAIALKADNKEKVHIISDTCIYNYKNGTSEFEGNVKVDQGTTHITADRLTTKSNSQHQIEEAIAYGKKELAHYWTVPKIGELEIHAHARVIKFYPISSNITLEQDVNVLQGENSFQGQLIHYNMSNQTITVPASKNGRAVLVYNPDR